MSQTFRAGMARRRSSLLVSAALLALPVAAHADDSVGPLDRSAAEREAQGTGTQSGLPDDVLREAYTGGVPAANFDPSLDPQILIANPNTITTAIDPANLTGIGQMVIDNQNGFISLCTGTLINPRTVIFAAHCVNSRPQTAYGENSGGQPIAFGFGVNNNAAGASAFGQWLNGAAGNKYATSVARALYDVNYVAWNIASQEPNAASFLYADVAVASLDTPAANIPTWAMLFSALPSTTITAATGSGYHVQIAGYGNNGTGQGGTAAGTGIDFRRRLAENLIGGLASLDQFENFLFGGASTTNPQNLYWIDFDDPRRGTAAATPFDFNAWRDNSVASGKEGLTSGGDSGGPLVLDAAYATKLVLGVLSGGYTRFFNGQPANSYGTAAFYQPLYLYWDYIAANNPYHYVSSVAGNADWSDPTHWVTTLDPNYYVLNASGQLVNGIPTDPGAGKTGNTGTWGQACFQSGGVSDCLDMKTGVEVVENKPIGTGGVGTTGNDALTVSADTLNQVASEGDDGAPGQASSQSVERVAATPQDVQGSLALPVATITNGLPGATNFVPNNSNGNRLTSTLPRYFDVNLNAAGTTTLGSAVTVDRFKITGAQAQLTVNAGGSLTSLIDITHMTGVINNNGTIRSTGDYLFVSGLLTGNGQIFAPFVTSALGNFAPGTVGTTGVLTIYGNLTMASGSTYAVDLGTGTTTDLIQVLANGPGTGQANVGGRLLFSVATGATPRAGNTYTILTATNGLTGTFTPPYTLSAILTPTVSYLPNAVNVTLVPGLYANVVSGTSPVQTAYAALLDQNRPLAGSSGLTGLFDVLDLQSAGTIQSTLEGLAPRTETLKTTLGNAILDNMARFYRERLNAIEPGSLGGSMAYIGKPLDAVARASMPGTISNSFAGMAADNAESTRVSEGQLPENVSGFLAGGYLDGDSAPMRTAVPGGGRDQFDGWYLAGGLEVEMGSSGVLGFGLSYSDIKGQTTLASQTASAKLYEGTIYGKMNLGRAYVDGVLSAGLLSARTARSATILATTYQLNSVDDALAVSGELGLGAMFGSGVEFGPRVSLRGSSVGFSRTNETGGGPALTLDRERVRSLEGRAGFVLKGAGRVRPFGSAYYVHEFEARQSAFFANFVGGQGNNRAFALGGLDRDWYEVSGGLAIDTGAVELSVSADTTIDRSDLQYQSYRGTIKFRF